MTSSLEQGVHVASRSVATCRSHHDCVGKGASHRLTAQPVRCIQVPKKLNSDNVSLSRRRPSSNPVSTGG